jgi:hypothetical protein
MRGVAPGPPRATPDAAAFEKLWKSGGSPKYRQPFDAQNFDAVVLCYLSAVAAGSTKGTAMKQWVRKISAPPGETFTWRQLPEAIKAIEAGKDIDYEGASGPINMDAAGNPTFGYYDVYRYRNARLGLFGSVSVPPSAKGFLRYKVIQITPKPPGPTPAPVPTGPTGASGASGASGATGTKGAKKKKSRRKRG